MNKITLFAAALCINTTAFAEWSKPTPTSTSLEVGVGLYLYNTGGDGFLLGDNDYSTRASISQKHGCMVYLEQYTKDNEWDGQSYYITSDVEYGNMAGQRGYMFIDNIDKIWVDNTKTGKENNRYTFNILDDGSYKIGLSSSNPTFNPTSYPDTYLGIIPEKNDTRIYLCDPNTYTLESGYDVNGFNVAWQLVTPEEYEKYQSELLVYESAVTLGEAIEKAKGVSGMSENALSLAEAVYNNHESTKAELDSTVLALNDSVAMVYLKSATVAEPVEVLALLGTVEQTFENKTTTGWTMDTKASNKQAVNSNNAKEPGVTGIHLENWNATAFGTGKIYATVTGIPTGVYKFSCLAYTNVIGGTYAYAGDQKTLVETEYINRKKPTEVTVIVDDGQLEFGLVIETVGTNWVGLDNVNLYYLGDSNEAYGLIIDSRLGTVTDYESMVESGEISFYSSSEYNAYKTSKSDLTNSKTRTAVAENLEAFKSAYSAFEKGVEAYKEYGNVFKEARLWLSAMSNKSQETKDLRDYLYKELEGGYNGNNCATYILENGSLSGEQIASEKVYLEALYSKAVASGMSEGTDCTALLRNANFAEEGGWTATSAATWPLGHSDEDGNIVYPVFEANNVACDVYQELTDLQNGIYELDMQGAFRPGTECSKENIDAAQAYAYINNFSSNVTCADIASADSASQAFAKGELPIKVYGLVTEHTMKVGITNSIHSVDGCMLWGGGAKLTFRGKNDEILDAMIAEYLPLAEEYVTNFCGSSELDALQYAIDNINKDDKFDALKELKRTIDDVKQSIALYTELCYALENLYNIIKNTNLTDSYREEVNEMYSKYYTMYENAYYTNDDCGKAIEEINDLCTRIKIESLLDIEVVDSVDYSIMIVNSSFDKDKGDKSLNYVEGWTTTAMNEYSGNSITYSNTSFDLSQKIVGLPAGHYKVKVHSYYSAGSLDDEENYIKDNIDTHLTTLYAVASDSTYSTKVMNLSEGASLKNYSSDNSYYITNEGLYAPNGTKASIEFFNAGCYTNSLEFVVPEDQTITIGISKDDIITNDYQIIGSWELWRMSDPEIIPDSIQDTTDVSTLIVNNNFDPTQGNKETGVINGWTTTEMTGYKGNTVYFSRSDFEIKQTISGLETGTYMVAVNSYYRAGYCEDEEKAIANGENTHLDTLFVETSDTIYKDVIKNLCEDATLEAMTEGNTFVLSNGYYVPDGALASADYFNAGYYVNELPFYVNDGTATIGCRKSETLANDYTIIGSWKLYYYGKGNYLQEIADKKNESNNNEQSNVISDLEGVAVASPVAYYSLSGSRLSAPQKGVNIVKMDNGMTLKIFVK
ncbi:MAG: hypothetical protein K6E54_00285 [Bacteroidaceae bacterium]|nr:hypothetical protein [Bacteroidaceae bacterium]